MSSSKSKSSSTQTTNQTATTTPNTPSWISQPWQDYASQVSNLMSSNTPLVTGASDLQNQAFAGAANLGSGNSTFNLASQLGLSAGTAGANTAGPAAQTTATGYTASGYNAAAAPTVTAYDPALATSKNITDLDLNKYLSAGLGDQISAAQADYDASNAAARARQAAIAAANGGFRNSGNDIRSGVLEGELTRATNTGLANIRANAYDQAGNLATSDLNRQASTSQFNAGSQNAALAQALGLQTQAGLDYAARQDAAGQFGANAQNQAGQFNATAQNQAGQFNAAAQNQMGQFNAGQQDNALTRQLQAAGLLGDLGNSMSSNQRADVALQGELGGIQRDIANAQASGDYARLAAISQLLGGIPLDAFVGQTQTGTGTTTGTSKSSQSGISFGWSPTSGLSFGG